MTTDGKVVDSIPPLVSGCLVSFFIHFVGAGV